MLTTFNYLTNSIRVIDIDGSPWFTLRDILPVIGSYLGPRSGVPNVSDAVRSLDHDQFQLVPIQVEQSNGRMTTCKVMLVSESGLYRFIMRSDKAAAKPFQDWVTRDVLPAIRKDGGNDLS